MLGCCPLVSISVQVGLGALSDSHPGSQACAAVELTIVSTSPLDAAYRRARLVDFWQLVEAVYGRAYQRPGRAGHCGDPSTVFACLRWVINSGILSDKLKYYRLTKV